MTYVVSMMVVSGMLGSALPALAAQSQGPSHAPATRAVEEEFRSQHLKVSMVREGRDRGVTFSIRVGSDWVAALQAPSVLLVRTPGGMEACRAGHVAPIGGGFLLEGNCSVGSFQQRISMTSEADVLDVSTRLRVRPGAEVRSVEDRYNFAPDRHKEVDEHTGPLDFVWSQNIKSEVGDVIPTNSFKSPAVMMQQGRVFAAILPVLNDRHMEVRAMDLDVTSDTRPWMSVGAIPSEPHGHSYFRRATGVSLQTIDDTVMYRYALVLSDQPERLGYRRVVHRLWQETGHPELMQSAEEQRNPLRPELHSFDSWREDAWKTYADRVYLPVACGKKMCGTLENQRSVSGDWANREPDAWFNAWFESLRTAYGWYLHGRATKDSAMMKKAESVLNLSLSSPQHGGAFGTIYLVKENKWVPGDGWASYADSYHAFSMSWTAYWMLRWAADLTPGRRAEVLAYVRPYGDFLLANQLASGVIPSWYRADTLQPREEFRALNAETAASALLLVTLSESTRDPRYLAGAERSMEFITREVLPRERWFDFETFLSCARKDFGFFDAWTAQYPQNNLAEMQAPQAMLALYRATGKAAYLERGSQMLDYLLLTQQVWNNPQFTPQLLGGFTTQNTDQEWSDARQGYAATLLTDFYQATGKMEYLERAVAAARSTFAVAPWENWAHTGYKDEPGAMTGFHWGTGSAMTSAEMMQPLIGDAFIDLRAGSGVGFDECSLDDVVVDAERVSFHIASASMLRRFHIRFAGVQAERSYRIRWNDRPPQSIAGEDLEKNGLEIGPIVQVTN